MEYGNLIKNIIKEKRSIEMSNSCVSNWVSWYQGYVRSFHSYKVYNGKNYVKRIKKSMHLAKRCCEDWAGLLWNEKVTITTPYEDNQAVIDYYDLQGKGNKAVELAFALSMSALVVNMEIDESSGRISLDYYNAKNIIPITFKNNEITEAAFVTHNTDGDVITAHIINKMTGFYEITVINVDKLGLVKSDILPVLNTESKIPLFTIIHPNVVNAVDIDSPYPVSIFANAIDIMMVADNVFDSYDNEFYAGRKRTFISAKYSYTDKVSGERFNTFDPNDLTIYTLPESADMPGQDNKPLIETKNGDALRAADHQIAIQDCLNLFSQSVGLGSGYYKFETNKIMTATQVMSEKSDMFKNKKRHELVLSRCIQTIVRALIYATSKWSTEDNVPVGIYVEGMPIVVSFDDSIIEDKEAKMLRDRTDVAAGLMSPIEYRVKHYGETEEQATAAIKKYFGDVSLKNRINSFNTALTVGAITPKEYVDNVFIDATNKEELISEISEALKGGVTADDLIGGNGA